MGTTGSLEQLARGAQAGSVADLDELLGQIRPLVLRTTRLIVGPGSWAAEDAAQEAMIEISRDLESVRDPAAVKAWALRIATRRAIRTARRERISTALRLSPELVAADNSLEEETTRMLKRAFDALPSKQRAVAVLRLHVGLNEAETAAVLGCSHASVRAALFKARSRLVDGLTIQGIRPTVQQGEGDA